MDPLLEFYLLENNCLKFMQLGDNRERCVKFLYERDNSKYLKRFEELARQPKNFYEHYQMTPDTYNYILEAIEDDLTKQSNFRKCISPTEKLSVTLR